MTGGVPALQTPEWGILQQVHWSFSQLQSSERRAERWSLSFLFPLAEEAHFTRTERLGMPEAYGWGPCMVAKGWMKDAWVTLPWAWHGQQAKLASWVTPAMVTFLLENVWARGMVARAMESAASQHWWVFTMVMFTVPFIWPACYGRFLLFRPTGYSWSLPKFWAFPCKKQVEILRLSSLRTWPWNQPQSIARYKVKNLVCTDK